MARLRRLLAHADDALVAALAHLSELRDSVRSELQQDLISIRAMRARLDERAVGSAPDTTRLPVESERLHSAAEADDQPGSGAAPLPELAALTSRERQVARLLARGLTNRQIAEELVISPTTARVHVEHILSKLGFHSRVRLVAWMSRQIDVEAD